MQIDERNMTRDAAILDAAGALTVAHGLAGFSRGHLATAAGMSRAGVSNYGRVQLTNGPQGTAGVLNRIRADLMAAAVERGDLALLRAGIAACHPVALAAPDELRIAAVAAS